MAVQFFVPQARPGEAETAYRGIVDSLKDQLRWPVTPRRIFSLKYIHDKKPCYVEVGGIETQTNRYEILAIVESTLFLVFTRARDGGRGVTILIDKKEVTEVTEFD